jgi:hypothetical protein
MLHLLEVDLLCAALANGSECDRYCDVSTKMMESCLYSFLINVTTFVTIHYYDSYIYIYIE